MGKTYNDGLNDAWNAALRIVDVEWSERHEMIGSNVSTLWDMMKELDPEDVVKRIKEYDDKRNIAVGDEVRFGQDERSDRYVVLRVTPPYFVCVDKNGMVYSPIHVGDAKKTGRTFPELQFILNKIGGR